MSKLRSRTCPDCRKPLEHPGPFPVNVSLLRVCDALNSSNEAFFFCDRHQNSEKEFFCLECRVTCCSECVIFGDHRGHSVERGCRLAGAELEQISAAANAMISHMENLVAALMDVEKVARSHCCPIKRAIEVTSTALALAQCGLQHAECESAKQLLCDLKQHAEEAALIEARRLENIAVEVRKASEKLKAAVVDRKTVVVLCLMPHLVGQLEQLKEQCLLPRVDLTMQIQAFSSASLSGKSSEGSRAGRVNEKGETVKGHHEGDVLDDKKAGGSTMRGLHQVEIDPGVGQGSKTSVKIDAASRSPVRWSQDIAQDVNTGRKRKRVPNSDLNSLQGRVHNGLAADCMVDESENDKTAGSVMSRFIHKHGLTGRIPLLTFSGGTNRRFARPTDVDFAADGSLLVADCLNNCIQAFAIQVGLACRQSSIPSHFPKMLNPTHVRVHPNIGMVVVATRQGPFCTFLDDDMHDQSTLPSQKAAPDVLPLKSTTAHVAAPDSTSQPVMIAFDPNSEALAVVTMTKVPVQSLHCWRSATGQSAETCGYRKTYEMRFSRQSHTETVELGFTPGGLAFDPKGCVIVTKKSDGLKTLRLSARSRGSLNLPRKLVDQPAATQSSDFTFCEESEFNFENSSSTTIIVQSISLRSASSQTALHVCTSGKAELHTTDPSKWKKVALTPLKDLASPEDFFVFSSDMRYSDEVVYALAEPLIIPKGRTLGGRLTKVCQFFSVIHVDAIAR